MIKSNHSNNSSFDSNLTSLSSSELSSICGGGEFPWVSPPFASIGGMIGGPVGAVIGEVAGGVAVVTVAGFFAKPLGQNKP